MQQKIIIFAWYLEGKRIIGCYYTYRIRFDEEMAPTPFPLFFE